jgi:hypothetical protein
MDYRSVLGPGGQPTNLRTIIKIRATPHPLFASKIGHVSQISFLGHTTLDG